MGPGFIPLAARHIWRLLQACRASSGETWAADWIARCECPTRLCQLCTDRAHVHGLDRLDLRIAPGDAGGNQGREDAYGDTAKVLDDLNTGAPRRWPWKSRLRARRAEAAHRLPCVALTVQTAGIPGDRVLPRGRSLRGISGGVQERARPTSGDRPVRQPRMNGRCCGFSLLLPGTRHFSYTLRAPLQRAGRAARLRTDASTALSARCGRRCAPAQSWYCVACEVVAQ